MSLSHSPRRPLRLGPATWAVIAVVAAILTLGFCASAWAQVRPTLPQKLVDVTYAPPPTRIPVPAGASLQQAVNTAQPGTTLVLQAGATYGNLQLPNKSGGGWIYIISSGNLPLPGNRIRPQDSAQLARVGAVTSAPGAHHYYLAGLEVPVSGTLQGAILNLDGGADQPHHITVRWSYIHAGPSNTARRGVGMHGADLALVDSYVADFKEQGADSQAVWCASGTGPLLIQNNFLQAAGENFMCGGGDPHPNYRPGPSDITIVGNHIFKPTSWRGSNWSIKNLLELKNGRRVDIRGNILENNWAASQSGFSFVLTPRNQDGSCPTCGTQDITVRQNRFLNVAQGFTIAGDDDTNSSTRTDRVLVEQNLLAVECVGCTSNQRGDGKAYQWTRGPRNVWVDHNTVSVTGTFAMSENTPLGFGFRFTNNVTPSGQYGFSGTGSGTGTPTLNRYYTNPPASGGWVFTANAILGANLNQYPSGNFNQFSGQLGTDGKPIGADSAEVLKVTACVVSGQCAGTTPPPPQDTTPPTLQIQSPSSGSIFPIGAAVTLQATATDTQSSVGPITWTANGTPTLSPYLTTTAGPVTLAATATDSAGNVGASSVGIVVRADPPPPTDPVDCQQGLWVLASLTQSSSSGGFTITLTRPTLQLPLHGGKGCGPSEQSFTSVVK